eukprot:1648323-Prymnesium_polylepis.1
MAGGADVAKHRAFDASRFPERPSRNCPPDAQSKVGIDQCCRVVEDVGEARIVHPDKGCGQAVGQSGTTLEDALQLDFPQVHAAAVVSERPGRRV